MINVLAPLKTVYGIGKKTEPEWRVFWGFYAKKLAGVPLEALVAAVDEYNGLETSEHFPKPGPLMALCDKWAIPLRAATWRAKTALKAIDAG